MKTFIKLIFLFIVIAITWNYLDHNNISVKDKFFDSVAWVQKKLKDNGQHNNPDSSLEEGNSDKKIIHNKVIISSIEGNKTERTIAQDIKNEYNNPGENKPDDDNNQIRQDGITDNSEWVKTETKLYSPDSWNLLMQYENLPERSSAAAADGRSVSSEKPVTTFYYLEGNTRTQILSSMATDIHEIAHGYCNQNIFKYATEKGLELDMNKAELFFYYSPSRSFFVSFPVNSLFHSNVLVSVIPENLRTFRFSTYIAGTTSTQREGVIGLLDELHSYYLESKFYSQMLDAYKTSEGSDAEGFYEWVHHSQSAMTAFYEFDFFIKEYLLYMKLNYPQDYLKLKSYHPFIEAYNAIRSSYEEVIKNYIQLINSEMDLLNSSGNDKAKIADNELWVRAGNSETSKGTPVFSEDREKLLPVLESDRYQEISADFH
jgi:hypothetical protein